MRLNKDSVGKILEQLLARFDNPSPDRMQSAIDRVSGRLHSGIEASPISVPSIDDSNSSVRRFSRFRLAAAAVFVLAIGMSAVGVHLWSSRDNGAHAIVESVDRSLYRNSHAIGIGDHVALNEIVRTDDGSGAQLTLADGSHVEMRSKSELSFERAEDGVRIRLNNGGVIVNAAKRRMGHLYVQTKDVVVSVVGTVFFVNAEEAGSRVAVIEGQVRIKRGDTESNLRPGEQVNTNPLMESQPVSEEISWSRNAAVHLAMLQQSASIPPVTDANRTTAPVPLQFEVASIKTTKSVSAVVGGCHGSDVEFGPNDIHSTVPIGRCVITAGRLTHIMAVAYKFNVNRIDGRPDWDGPTRFDIEAKAESSTATQQQLLQMLQALLADRFKLKIIRETRQLSGYTLVVAKNGPKLREAQSTEESRLIVNGGNGGKSNKAGARDDKVPYLNSITGQKTSMAQLVEHLSLGAAGGPVVDQTDLKGYYDFTLNWESGESLSAALQEQLGLKLEPQKVAVEFITIDSAEKPTEN